uniref:hypothetical protein n=1 Tax=Yoonia sp. TaxID=2212373 RepID=UPI0040472748
MPAMKRSYSTQGGGPSKRAKSNAVVMGRISGKVKPTATTLARCLGPFANKRYVTFLYENSLTKVNPAATILTMSTMPNSLYDYDKTASSYFGNKQPLYFDSLLTASGPYKGYQVISWKTTYTVINSAAVPLMVFAIPPVGATAEIDSLAEADNFPGVKKLALTASTGSKNIGKITVWGHQNDVLPIETLTASSTTASYAGDPGTGIYSGLFLAAADGATNIDCYVSVCHEAYTELQNVDA